MRQFLTALTGMVLLGSLIGCHHTCGICDCGTYTPCSGACCPVTSTPITGTFAVPVETLKVMPKGETKEQ
jgi:hypothetical protein